MAETITTPEQMREAAAQCCDINNISPNFSAPAQSISTAMAIAAAIRAIPIAPQPVAVKPLVWHDCEDGTAHDDECRYEIEKDGKYWRVIRGVTGGTSYLSHAASYDTAKAAAQADYEARILSALTIHPADPLSDPRVVALVEAAKAFMHDVDDLIANSEGVSGLHMNGDVADWESLLPGGMFGAWLVSIDEFRAALRAIGGEA